MEEAELSQRVLILFERVSIFSIDRSHEITFGKGNV